MAVEHYPGWVTLILFYFVTSVLFYVESSAIYKELNITCLKTKFAVKASVCGVYVCVFPFWGPGNAANCVSSTTAQTSRSWLQLLISIFAKHRHAHFCYFKLTTPVRSRLKSEMTSLSTTDHRSVIHPNLQAVRDDTFKARLATAFTAHHSAYVGLG